MAHWAEIKSDLEDVPYLIPHIPFVDLDPMFVAKLTKFILKRSLSMMFFLTVYVFDHSLQA